MTSEITEAFRFIDREFNAAYGGNDVLMRIFQKSFDAILERVNQADLAEARIKKLREALREIRDMSCGCSDDWQCPSCVARQALAETTKENR